MGPPFHQNSHCPKNPHAVSKGEGPQTGITQNLPLNVSTKQDFLFQLHLSFFTLFPRNLRSEKLLLGLKKLFTKRQLSAFRAIDHPSNIIHRLPLPYTRTKDPAGTTTFRLNPNIHIELSIGRRLRTIILPIRFRAAPVRLPTKGFLLYLFKGLFSANLCPTSLHVIIN